MATILKGAETAKALTAQLQERVRALGEKGVTPCLAIIRVGAREDDLAYERGALKRCEKVGIQVREFLLAGDYEQQELLAAVEEINADKRIHGCLIFRPLPVKGDESAVCALLAPEKDVDGITDGSLAAVFSGGKHGYPPCTAAACVELLKHAQVPLTGKRVVVVGRSLVIGKPVSMLLLGENATVTVCHSRTENLPAVCREADVLVVAAGRAGMIGAACVRPGQVVIDVGINVDADGNLCGDVYFAAVEPIVDAITPVPGGVGAVTTAVLCKHVVEAAERAAE